MHALGHCRIIAVSYYLHTNTSLKVRGKRLGIVGTTSYNPSVYYSDSNNALYVSQFQYGLLSIELNSWRRSMPTVDIVTGLPSDAVEITEAT